MSDSANIVEGSPRTFPDSMKMTEALFWNMIDESRKSPLGQTEYLVERLSTATDQEIIGFECTFREKMIELWHYNIKALYQIMNGDYISTDDFVYFRCALILLGKNAYETALYRTDSFALTINPEHSGEFLLSVADQAFKKKHPGSLEETMPRNVTSSIDYDFGAYRMRGTYIPMENYEQTFPRLTDQY